MCPNAIPTDEYHGYGCSVTGDSCIYLFPFVDKCEMLDEIGDTQMIKKIKKFIYDRIGIIVWLIAIPSSIAFWVFIIMLIIHFL